MTNPTEVLLSAVQCLLLAAAFILGPFIGLAVAAIASRFEKSDD